MKLKVIFLAYLIIGTVLLVMTFKEKPGLKSEIKNAKANPIKSEKFISPLANYSFVNDIKNDTIYFAINLEAAKNDLKIDNLFLITTSNGIPQKITEDNFKVKNGDNFNFLAGDGLEKMNFIDSNFPNGALIRVNFKNGQPVDN